MAARVVIVVRCPCERNVEYHPGFLQRRHQLPSDALVFDLQIHNGWRSFRITAFDNPTRGDSPKPRLDRAAAGE